MREVYTPLRPQFWMDDTVTPARWRWKEPACYIFPPRWEQVLTAPGMTGQAFRLLCGILLYLGWRNQCTASLGMIGRKIGMAEATRTRALRRLEQARLIAVDRSDSRGLVITVSPALVWVGRPHHVYKARRAFQAQCLGLPYAQDEDEDDNTPVASPATVPGAPATTRAPAGG